ncbi:MAG: ribokinase [Chloroflexi bacterium]|nr:ribokinase [Chloroflexota bacterium]
MTDILVIGSINADLVVRAARFPAPGETLQGSDLATIPGGKGANQAVAAARLSASVSMTGRVGNDSFGSTLIDNLKQNRVDVSRIIRDDSAATGTAIIIVDANGQNSIVLSPGANAKVGQADVKAASFSDFNLLLLQLEIPTETVLHAARLANQNGLRVLLNPAPAKEIPDELIALADFILPNETELSLLIGKPVSDVKSAESAARSLVARGAKVVIVTLGANGALIVDKTRATHIPSFKVNVVDTTAAGDAFIGGFAIALLNGKSLETAVQYASACGALAVTKFGAQTSLPTAIDVENFLKR